MKAYAVTMQDGYKETIIATDYDEAVRHAVNEALGRVGGWRLLPQELQEAVKVFDIQLVEV